jgi:hypothetical protein
MRTISKILLYVLLLSCVALPVGAAEDLDQLYGMMSQPAYIKHYEADKNGKVMLNPYLQVVTKDHPGVIDSKRAPYNWVIDGQGRLVIIQEAAHPYGRTYEKGFFRPEDQSKRKPGTTENFGHVSALAGGPGRISGEILFDKESKLWTINNKSGRYTKHNTDRTPEQLVNAAKLIREGVDTGNIAWGPVYYLLEYTHEDIAGPLMKSPQLAYDDPKTKSRPHIVVMPGAPASPKAGPSAPAVEQTVPKVEASPVPKVESDSAVPVVAKPKKVKKPKAAQNDDPS